jgi:hypothetical protein
MSKFDNIILSICVFSNFDKSIITRKLNHIELYNQIKTSYSKNNFISLIEYPILFSLIVKEYDLYEAYDDFMYANKTKLEDEFYAINEFRTSIRGVKVRGTYSNPKEAELKAKKLQQKDKYHNIFLGEVGKWTPWDPQPHEVADQEYAQDELNTLMRKYKENEDNREKFFEERTKGAKGAAGANTKQVFGGEGSASDTFGNMFNGTGDMAIQRKIEQASVTIERVEENSVVEPKTE